MRQIETLQTSKASVNCRAKEDIWELIMQAIQSALFIFFKDSEIANEKAVTSGGFVTPVWNVPTRLLTVVALLLFSWELRNSGKCSGSGSDEYRRKERGMSHEAIVRSSLWRSHSLRALRSRSLKWEVELDKEMPRWTVSVGILMIEPDCVVYPLRSLCYMLLPSFEHCDWKNY